MRRAAAPLGVALDLSTSARDNLEAVGRVQPGYLAVSEMFESFQGEGVRAGLPSFFVRLRYCDGTCHWCDAKYTWLKGGEGREMKVAEVLTAIRNSSAHNVVITGGEPLLQWRALTDLIRPVLALHKSVEIETNGAHAPLGIFGVQYNVSPKLPGARAGLAYDRKTLDAFKGEDSWFKLVIASEDDFREATVFVQRFGLPPARVLFMPEATDRDTLHERLGWLAPLVMRDFPLGRVVTRLHVEVHGKALRGV